MWSMRKEGRPSRASAAAHPAPPSGLLLPETLWAAGGEAEEGEEEEGRSTGVADEVLKHGADSRVVQQLAVCAPATGTRTPHHHIGQQRSWVGWGSCAQGFPQWSMEAPMPCGLPRTRPVLFPFVSGFSRASICAYLRPSQARPRAVVSQPPAGRGWHAVTEHAQDGAQLGDGGGVEDALHDDDAV